MRDLLDKAFQLLLFFLKITSLKDITFIRIGRLNRDYNKYKKDWKRFKHIHKFIGHDNTLYVLRESNNKLRAYFENHKKDQGIILLGKSMMGKTTMVFNEMLRNRKSLKGYWLFMPESAEALDNWHRKLPLRIDASKIIIFLDDLNKYATIDQQTFSKILERFKNRKPILIATCRTGDEWKSIESKFGDFFPNRIDLEKISKQEAEKLAKKVEGAAMQRFDGSPGSVVLGIGIQQKKIKDLEENSPDCYAILQAAVICNHFLWFESYNEELIQSIIKNILESGTVFTEYIGYTKKLEDNELVALSEKGEVSIIDAYLDIIMNSLEKHKASIIKKLETFVLKNKEYLERFAYYYNFRIGVVLAKKGEFDRAIAIFRKSIALKKDSAVAWNNLGNALADKGDTDNAIKALRKAIMLKKDYPEAWNNLGSALNKKGEIDEAIEAFGTAIELKEYFTEPWYNLGNALFKKGEIDKAIEAYQKALTLKEDDHDAWVNLGNALSKKGETDNAIKAYKKAITLKNDNPNAWNCLGVSFGLQGKIDSAIKTFNKAILLKESFPEAWNNLGGMLVKKYEINEAIKAFKKAIHFKEDYQNAWSNLGVVLRIKGDVEESRKAFKKAEELEKKKKS